MTPEQVKALIEDALPCQSVVVEGDGHHFYASIVSPAFCGLGLLARHRLVLEKVKPQLDSGELHALSLRQTQTPEEVA